MPIHVSMRLLAALILTGLLAGCGAGHAATPEHREDPSGVIRRLPHPSSKAAATRQMHLLTHAWHTARSWPQREAITAHIERLCTRYRLPCKWKVVAVTSNGEVVTPHESRTPRSR
jgi:hypothetical protein